jgi:hypothetical protein
MVYYTVLYYTILYYTVLYYIILYYTVLYYIVLYYTVLYYTILYYTILATGSIIFFVSYQFLLPSQINLATLFRHIQDIYCCPPIYICVFQVVTFLREAVFASVPFLARLDLITRVILDDGTGYDTPPYAAPSTLLGPEYFIITQSWNNPGYLLPCVGTNLQPAGRMLSAATFINNV